MYTDPFSASGLNPGYNPLADLEKNLEKQLSQIREMAKNALTPAQHQNDSFESAVRGVVDRYMQERDQAATPQPMQAIAAAIESSLPADHVKFLAENISAVPDFLRSKDGKDLLGMMIDGLKKSGESSGANTAAAPESGQAAR